MLFTGAGLGICRGSAVAGLGIYRGFAGAWLGICRGSAVARLGICRACPLLRVETFLYVADKVISKNYQFSDDKRKGERAHKGNSP